MPYNTTAIPPRKEVTGQNQLPLSRVKKIIAQDQDINMCSNNAAFVITLATEMFIQHLSEASHTQTKLDRKPRRNMQYRDVANAVSHQDNLEFLEDIVPKTVKFKSIKDTVMATQARLRGEEMTSEEGMQAMPGTKAAEENSNGTNGTATTNGEGVTFSVPVREQEKQDDDPNDQLEQEMRQAAGPPEDGDVSMTG